MPSCDDEMYICSGCVKDEFLKKEIRTEGSKETCSFCKSRRNAIELDDLVGQIRDIIQEHFYITSSTPTATDYLLVKEGVWERPGESVSGVIAQIVGADECGPVVEAIHDRLMVLYDNDIDCEDNEESPYGYDARYEGRRVDDRHFRETWESFKCEIAERSRFFSQEAKHALDKIFSGLDKTKTYDGTPIILDVKPGQDNDYFYRVRVALSEKELKEILADPVMGLGPPPQGRARAGRMNPAGISVFYGAFDAETCVAEARPPVGSHLVLGKFQVIRPIRLLDFDALKRISVEGSYFDTDFHTNCGRATFLRRLVMEMARPAMPDDEEFEYLPTQAVSEYLAQFTRPRVDGILFYSTQTARERQNVVLFNHACGVEPYDVPDGSKVDIRIGGWADDEYNKEIDVFEEMPEEVFALEVDNSFNELRLKYPSSLSTHPMPTLKLDIEGMKVLYVSAVTFDCGYHDVNRYRFKKGETIKLK